VSEIAEKAWRWGTIYTIERERDASRTRGFENKLLDGPGSDCLRYVFDQSTSLSAQSVR
jgi:hypothetical protein